MLPANRHVVAGLGIVHVVTALVLYATGNLTPEVDVPFRAGGMFAAHALAASLCIAIARDYPTGSLLRRAWLLFAFESVCMGSRALTQTGIIPTGAFHRDVSITLVTIGSASMIAGMLTTGYALRRMGLSFQLYTRDIIAMMLTADILPVVIWQRYGWPPALDWSASAPVTIFLTVIVSIPLLRFSRQMGSALLARTYVWIVAYMGIRCVFHLLSAVQISGVGSGEWVVILRYGIGYGAAWLFAYAAALRYEAVWSARRELLNLSRVRETAAAAR